MVQGLSGPKIHPIMHLQISYHAFIIDSVNSFLPCSLYLGIVDLEEREKDKTELGCLTVNL